MLLEFNAMTLITQSVHLREIMNGAIFSLCLFLSAMLFFLMARMWVMMGSRWYKEDGMASICVLSWLFAIVGFRSGLVWFNLRIANDGYIFTEQMEVFSNWALIVSAVVFAAITLRATYLWSPVKWHNRAWMASSLFAMLFLLVSELL